MPHPRTATVWVSPSHHKDYSPCLLAGIRFHFRWLLPEALNSCVFLPLALPWACQSAVRGSWWYLSSISCSSLAEKPSPESPWAYSASLRSAFREFWVPSRRCPWLFYPYFRSLSSHYPSGLDTCLALASSSNSAMSFPEAPREGPPSPLCFSLALLSISWLRCIIIEPACWNSMARK